MIIFIFFIFIYVITVLVDLFLIKYSRKKEYIDEDEAEVSFWVSIIPIINISTFIMLIVGLLYKSILKSKFCEMTFKIKYIIIL